MLFPAGLLWHPGEFLPATLCCPTLKAGRPNRLPASGLVDRSNISKPEVLINKSDKLDVRGLNRLRRTGTLPTVWIPPAEVRDQRDLLPDAHSAGAAADAAEEPVRSS